MKIAFICDCSSHQAGIRLGERISEMQGDDIDDTDDERIQENLQARQKAEPDMLRVAAPTLTLDHHSSTVLGHHSVLYCNCLHLRDFGVRVCTALCRFFGIMLPSDEPARCSAIPGLLVSFKQSFKATPLTFTSVTLTVNKHSSGFRLPIPETTWSSVSLVSQFSQRQIHLGFSRNCMTRKD